MDKRTFLKNTAITAAGAIIAPQLIGCGTDQKKSDANDAHSTHKPQGETGLFELPPLPYAYDAYAPVIDARTMEIHHSKHHAGYVRKLNKALEDHPGYRDLTLDVLMSKVLPSDTAIRNNGGGHYNHSLYWSIIKPGGSTVKGPVSDWLMKKYTSFDAFKTELTKAATGRFGSGWAWMGIDKNGDPTILSTPNQDNPMMSKIYEDQVHPLIGIDVWEHAYYLHYQNERKRYVTSFFELLDWEAINERYLARIG